MPRLPTIRVMGSQLISTKFRFLPEVSLNGSVIVPISLHPLRSCSFASWAHGVRARSGVIAGNEFATATSPLRLAVDGIVRNCAKGSNHLSVERQRSSREASTRRLIHEWHEHVGE